MRDKNLEIIERRWPALLLESQQYPSFDPAIEVVSHNDQQSIRVDGILLASAYDRAAEAELLSTFYYQEEQQLWLYGVGLGDLPRVLLSTSTLEQLNIVLIAPQLFFRLLDFVDYTDCLADTRVELHLPVEPRMRAPYAVVASEFSFVCQQALPLRDRIMEELRTPLTLDEHALTAEIEQRFADTEPFWYNDGDLCSLFNCHSGETFFVVAAGPTLRQSVALLKTYREQAKIVAVDKTVETLLVNDIVPDFVVTMDGHEVVTTFFEGIDERIDLSVMTQVPLVYFPRVHPDVLAMWPGPRYPVISWEPIYENFRRQGAFVELRASGSVIHPATDLAIQLGAGEIVFFGADFGFPIGVFSVYGRPAPQTHESERYLVENGRGQMIGSNSSFRGFLRKLENYIVETPRVRFYNSSREGARIEGVQWWEHALP